MREFYKQVRVDEKEYRFFAKCSLCGNRHYARKLPILCRRPKITELVENGRAGILKRRLYNKSLVSAVQYLMRYYNMCRDCGNWVCNDCFLPDMCDGICKNCSKHTTSQ